MGEAICYTAFSVFKSNLLLGVCAYCAMHCVYLNKVAFLLSSFYAAVFSKIFEQWTITNWQWRSEGERTGRQPRASKAGGHPKS